MRADEVQVELASEKRSGIREPRLDVCPRSRPVQGDLAQIPDTGRELHPDQFKQREVHQDHPVGIGRVLGDRQILGVAQRIRQIT
ncbi:MAG: hypothetical protein JWN03_4583 [Nocardia sp.]|nr:hypothetical protein [Nocardia sp.]